MHRKCHLCTCYYDYDYYDLSDTGAPEIRTSFLHESCELWRSVGLRAKAFGSWCCWPWCCWHLNPNFRVTKVLQPPRDSVLPWTQTRGLLNPRGLTPATPHLPGPRSALRSPRRAPSGTSPLPAAAAHAPAPRLPRCPLQHRKPGEPGGPAPPSWRGGQPPPGSSVRGCGPGSPSADEQGAVAWRAWCHRLAPGGLDLVPMLPEDPAPFLM